MYFLAVLINIEKTYKAQIGQICGFWANQCTYVEWELPDFDVAPLLWCSLRCEQTKRLLRPKHRQPPLHRNLLHCRHCRQGCEIFRMP